MRVNKIKKESVTYFSQCISVKFGNIEKISGSISGEVKEIEAHAK